MNFSLVFDVLQLSFCLSIHPSSDYNISRKVAGSITDEAIGFFNWPNPSSRNNGPGVDSASNRNEYQESSWG
jgi:hypothetical protein